MERSPLSPLPQPPIDPAPARDAAGGVAGELNRLIAAGKCKQAVELAKLEHKRLNTPDTERQLVQAYLARIDQFNSKGIVEEANTLVELVRQRFPGKQEVLARLEVRGAAAGGRVGDLVAPLAGEAATPEHRALIEAAIRQQLTDLPGLAACEALPADHPLRVAAAAILRAFEAVTAGPVTEDQLSLPEVSRRSPLADWKVLVRAIAAFYRHDDEACRRALDAMAPDAAAARLAPVLRAMVDSSPVAGTKAAALRARVSGDDQLLRKALEEIEAALRRVNLSKLKRSIRDALRACSASHPEICERMRQHVSIACLIHDVPVEEVLAVLGPSRKDAYFWRLLARASEVDGVPVSAAIYWERFVRHAVHEGMFTDGSLEAAVVYLHAANLLRGVSLVKLRELVRRFGELDVLTSYYRGQPPEIAALAPRSDAEVVEKVLHPGWLYQQAARIHPDADTFARWWSWAEEIDLPDRDREDIARQWHEKRPGDPGPLLKLSVLAERRNALKLAMKHLSAAEALDSLDPQVRKARVRLTLATTWRHFKDRKPHLVEKDLSELESVPGMGEGDRAAFLVSLRGAWHTLRGDAPAARADAEEVIAAMGPIAGAVVWHSVALLAGTPGNASSAATWPATPDAHDVARGVARSLRLAADLGFTTVRPAAWDAVINDVLRQGSCPLGPADLLAIGRAAAQRLYAEQAYLASSAGLASGGAPVSAARFLLLRAQALTATWGHRRAAQCLLAALKLARQAHDPELLHEILAEIDDHPGARYQFASRDGSHDLGDDLLAEVLKSERAASDFPRKGTDADRHLVVIEKGRGGGGLLDDEFWDDDYDDDLDDVGPAASNPLNLPGPLGNLEPEMARELLKVLQKRNGKLPNPEELLRTNPDLLMQLLALTGLGPMDENAEDPADEDDAPPPSLFDRFFGRGPKNRRKRK